MNPRQFKAVVFDLDGTLFPEKQFALSGFKAVSRYLDRIYGVNIYRELAGRYLSGERGNLITETLQAHFKLVEPLLAQKLAEIYRCHLPKLEPYPDIRIALALLNAKGIKTALMSDGYGCVQRNKLRAAGLDELFDAVMYADDLGGEEFWKPCPEPFYVLAIQLDLETGEMAYVGDNPQTDFAGPRRAGMKTIQIERPDGEHAAAFPPTPQHEPHVKIESLDMILDALDRLESGATRDAEIRSVQNTSEPHE